MTTLNLTAPSLSDYMLSDGDYAGGTSELWLRNNDGYPRNGLIKFDLSSLPAAATVTAVTLSLYKKTAGNTVAATLYRTLRDWTEAAKWSKYDGTNNWTLAGCNSVGNDRVNTSMGSISISSGTGWYNVSLDLTEFASMRSSNKGFVLIGSTGTGDNVMYGRTGTNPPKLAIDYYMPGQIARIMAGPIG